MSFFKRSKGSENARPQLKSTEQEIIFEEVAEEKAEDFTYREDPVEAKAGAILALEEEVEQARDAWESGEGNKADLAIKEVLLAMARYEQASMNERMGRGRKGEADRLLGAWQEAQDALDSLREEQMQDVRDAALSRLKDDVIDADTAAQLRRHP